MSFTRPPSLLSLTLSLYTSTSQLRYGNKPPYSMQEHNNSCISISFGYNMTEQTQTTTKYAPCEHRFVRILNTSMGDVNSCNKCHWTFFQYHGIGEDKPVVSMGRILDVLPTQPGL